jgi:hypothetical protein
MDAMLPTPVVVRRDTLFESGGEHDYPSPEA